MIRDHPQDIIDLEHISMLLHSEESDTAEQILFNYTASSEWKDLDGMDFAPSEVHEILTNLLKKHKEDMANAYHGGWRKSKKYAKKTNFHGLSRNSVKNLFFNTWFKEFKKR